MSSSSLETDAGGDPGEAPGAGLDSNPPASSDLEYDLAPAAPAPQPDAGPSALSPSQLKLFEECPRKWKFRYIDKLPDPSGLAAVIGSFAHRVLELLMSQPPEARTTETAQALAKDAFAETSQDASFLDLNLGPPAIARFKWRAWSSILKLWELEDPQAVNVAEVETKLSLTVAGVPFIGYVDRLDHGSTGLVVNDYKSGKPDFPKTGADPQRLHLENSHVFQVMLYAAAITEELADMPTQVRLLYLGDNVGELVEEVTPQKLDDATAKLKDGWEQLSRSRASNSFEANPTALCGWCPFLAHCSEGMDNVIMRKDAGKLKDTAPALRLKEILFNR